MKLHFMESVLIATLSGNVRFVTAGRDDGLQLESKAELFDQIIQRWIIPRSSKDRIIAKNKFDWVVRDDLMILVVLV